MATTWQTLSMDGEDPKLEVKHYDARLRQQFQRHTFCGKMPQLESLDGPLFLLAHMQRLMPSTDLSSILHVYSTASVHSDTDERALQLSKEACGSGSSRKSKHPSF